jgi:hypothetical protein
MALIPWKPRELREALEADDYPQAEISARG